VRFDESRDLEAVDSFDFGTKTVFTMIHREPPLLVAPYITREIAERCRQLGLPFLDTAGNAYLEAPGLFVYVTGNNKPADFRSDQFRALNPAGL